MRYATGLTRLFILLAVMPAIFRAQTPPAQPAPAQTPPAPQPRTGQRATAPVKPPAPLTLRQVIESLSSTRNSRRAEDSVSRAGVQFYATPAILDILKQFGASPKLISMIPAPPAPPALPPPPKPKLAGPLTVVCQPKDCMVVVEDRYEGMTDQNRKTVNGLTAGESTVRVFADGYEQLSQRVALTEGKPSEVTFALKQNPAEREEIARALLLKTLVRLGGVRGLAEAGSVEMTGTLLWTTNTGSTEQWSATFNKRPGRNLNATFKSSDGQCTVTINSQDTRTECRGGLRNGGDKIAEQASSLFLSYEVNDVLDVLLRRRVLSSETDPNRLESAEAKDSYTLQVGEDGLPRELVYRIGEDQPILVQYSSYMTLGRGLLPGQMTLGRVNRPPSWTLLFKTIRNQSR